MNPVRLKIALCSRTFDLNQTAHDPRVQIFFKTTFGAVVATVIKDSKSSFASGATVDFIEEIKSAFSENLNQAQIRTVLEELSRQAEQLAYCIIAVTENSVLLSLSGTVKLLCIRNSVIKDIGALKASTVSEMTIYKSDVFIICSGSLYSVLGSERILNTLSDEDPANCCSALISRAKQTSDSEQYSVQIINILSGELKKTEEKVIPPPVTKTKPNVQTPPPESLPEQNEPIMPRQKYSKRPKNEKNKLLYGIIILLLIVLVIVLVMNIFKKDSEEVLITNDVTDTTEVIEENIPAVNTDAITSALKVVYSGSGLKQSDVLKHFEQGSFSYKGERSMQTSTFDIPRLVSNINSNNLVFEKLDKLSKSGDSYTASFIVDFKGDKNKYEMVFSEGTDGKLKLHSITFSEKVSKKETEEIPEQPTTQDTVRTRQQEQTETRTRRDTLRDLPTPRRVTEDTTGTRTVPTPKPEEEKKEESGTNGNNNNGTNN